MLGLDHGYGEEEEGFAKPIGEKHFLILVAFKLATDCAAQGAFAG